MEVSNYRSINKGCLKGSFDVSIPQYGLTIADCKLFQKEGKRWTGFPSKVYVSGGEEKHFEYIRMKKERKVEFDAKCLELLTPLILQEETIQKPVQACVQSGISSDEIPF